MTIRLWPLDYEKKEHINKAEKALLRDAKKHFGEGHFAVNIDPLGMSTDKVQMGMYISPKEGLVTFSIYSGKINFNDIDSYITYVSFIEDRIYERLLDSKVLIVRDGDKKALKFPYKHVIMFPDERVGGIAVMQAKIRKLLPYVTYNFFRPITSKGQEKRITDFNIFSNIRKPFDKTFKMIQEIECRAIFERLAPEYTVVIPEIDDIKIPTRKIVAADEDLTITGEESEYTTFFLDEYQVAQVNDMGQGHRIILANPGAGKSVLLLSKAFKYASVYKESNVLLTCYNNNLADSYIFRRNCANFGDRKNIFIMTFHKLVKKIYEECLNDRLEDNIATEEEIKNCIKQIKNGNVKLRFKAIFIDEVQIFDPLYLELCYLLLESDTNGVFLMAGDLNQAVRALSRKGDAPWKRMRGIKLNFNGRVKYIEKNYRNSIEIGKYISKMLKLMNDRLSMLGLINSMEYEYNSFTLSDKPTIALKVKVGIPRINIRDEVLKVITELIEKYHLRYSDIAILFPYKQHACVRYYFLNWLKASLDDKGIPYSLITSDGANPNSKTRYSQTTGIVLSTIESSLGLDFKAVILAGLFPYSYVFKETNGSVKKEEISSWTKIKNMSDESQARVQSQMRAIYTACSRARDVLYVLSDIKEGTPMEEILKQ